MEEHSADLLPVAQNIVKKIRLEMAARLVGKSQLVDALITALLSGGHILLEGVPGLAKTLAVRSFAELAGLSFKRIQFTPDLLPGDISGSLFYDAKTESFVARKGPVFANIILADEINRAPAKVQSALLEAMEERQVSMGSNSLKLPEPFIVLATQNPIEHEGTFRLPEAQLDRFMLKVLLDYPDEKEELEILRLYSEPKSFGAEARTRPKPVFELQELDILKEAVKQVRLAPEAEAYIVAIVRATRPSFDNRSQSQALRDLLKYIEFGASPRASIALYRSARVAAFLAGRDHVLPEDIKQAAPAVLRHRIIPSYEAEAERISPDALVKGILSAVALP